MFKSDHSLLFSRRFHSFFFLQRVFFAALCVCGWEKQKKKKKKEESRGGGVKRNFQYKCKKADDDLVLFGSFDTAASSRQDDSIHYY